jgi:hypothetical protein
MWGEGMKDHTIYKTGATIKLLPEIPQISNLKNTSGENYIIWSLMICTPHPTLFRRYNRKE